MAADSRVSNLRFPALAIDGLAGTSFKHEHLSAILGEGAFAHPS
jgi:hypothetical protein